MPTAAKLIAAVAFAIVGWLAALAYIPQLPESINTGYFPHIMAGLGFLIGWLALGPLAGRGYVDGVSYGLRAAMLMVLWALLGFSIYFMILKSTKMIYKNAGEAVLDVPNYMVKYGQLLASVPVIVVLVIGGILGGVATEFVGRRWK